MAMVAGKKCKYIRGGSRGVRKINFFKQDHFTKKRQ